jgi:uncharacterized protein YchJ
MSRWSKSLLVILLINVLILGLVGCSGGTSSPEDTVRAAFAALESQNADKLISYYVEDVRDTVLAKTEYAFAFVDKFKVSNLELTVLSETEDTASVEADYDLTTTLSGQSIKEHITEIYELAKVDGEWLLLGEATEVERVEATPEPTPTPPAFSSPEGTVLEYYRSLAARDIGAIQKCFREDFRDGIVPALEDYYSYTEYLSFLNLELEVVNQTESEATIMAYYEIYVTQEGETYSSPTEEDIYLQKVGGKWLIAEDMGLW